MLKEFEKGQVIFSEGDFEMSMYDLLQGSVGIYAYYGKPEEKLLTELKAEDGATFGEMGLLESMPRSATAVALENVQVQVITGETFGEYFRDNPAAVMVIMQNMSQRIRALTQDYLDACRAVSEAVESETSGKEKSGWFKEKVGKFLQDYENTMREVARYGGYNSTHIW